MKIMCRPLVNLPNTAVVIVLLAAIAIHRLLPGWAWSADLTQFLIGSLLAFLVSRYIQALSARKILRDNEKVVANAKKKHFDESNGFALPPELAVPIASYLGVAGVARVGATSPVVRTMLLESNAVWAQLAVNAGLAPARIARETLGKVDECVTREAFRRAAFHLQIDQLSQDLKADRGAQRLVSAERLHWLASMVRALKCCDGTEAITLLSERITTAMWQHDFTDCESTHAAGMLLRTVETRTDVFSQEQLFNINWSHQCSRDLDQLMESSMRKQYEELPLVKLERSGGIYGDGDNNGANADSVDWPSVESLLQAEYEAMHDAEYEAAFPSHDLC